MIDQDKIHNQCFSYSSSKRIEALKELIDNFSLLPYKQEAWNDLIKLASENHFVRYWIISALDFFSNDLIKLTTNRDCDVRRKAADTLSFAFFDVPDKQQALDDLHILTNDKDSYVKARAALAICFSFSQVQDKQQMWEDLIKLTNNEENSYVKINATDTLGSAFSHVPDKQKAWNDLIELTTHEGRSVWFNNASALGSAFSHVPDKQKAWNDLIELTNDENSDVRYRVVSALGSAFSQVPDKKQAWNDLHRLTNDEDSDVRSSAAFALGSVYSQVLDKQQVWNDLIGMTNDENSEVRTSSNHSLGKVCIFKASQAEKEEDYKNELEEAIEFFEKTAQESAKWNNPAQFCLPFYRSFHTILFEKQNAKEEVGKFLAEAKDAIRGSKNKKLLFEAVENLANALKEVQNLENLDLEAKKGELNFYRQYCDHAAEIMIETKESAPFATIAMRKGLPILDRNLKGLLEEIQKKAKIACKESKGADTEEIACTINSEIQRWEIGSQEEMAFNLENLIFTLEANTPRNLQSDFIIDRIKQIPEQKDVEKQYGMLNSIITFIIKSSSEQKLQEIGEKVDQIGNKLEEITIFLKPGISEELIIHVGPITQWGGIEYTMSIPLQDISYPEIKEDLQKIVGKKIDKLSKMPSGLANKVRDYLVQKKMWSILDKLT